jgi:GDP-mannose transporter
VKSVPLKTRSGPVIYTNLLGFLPMLMLATVGNEYSKFYDSLWKHTDYRIPPASIPFLIMGSLVGTGIGYSGWWCRTVVSATSFTLIGGKCPVGMIRGVSVPRLPHSNSFMMISSSKPIIVVNKCLTILLNTFIWDQHAKPGGIASLFLCIVGGIVYQQAPMRGEKPKLTVDAEDDAFKSDISVEAHSNEETVDLLERQPSTPGQAKRRG